MLSYHDFDLVLLAQKHEMDFLSYAKFVNYLRHIKTLLKDDPTHPDLIVPPSEGWNWDTLDTLFTSPHKPWENDKWLNTFKEDDGLLALCKASYYEFVFIQV